MLLFGTTCQLQKSRLKFKISINLLAEPHCPCSRKGQWPWENMDNDIVQRHFGEKFPFHLKLIHTQTPGEGWSLTTLLVSPRAWQDPLFSPTSYKLKTNINSPTPGKIPFPWGRKISPLGLKTSPLSKFLTNHYSFSAWLTRQRFEWQRSPMKTGLWPCPHSLVIDLLKMSQQLLSV